MYIFTKNESKYNMTMHNMSICFIDTETSGLPIQKGFNTYHHPSLINNYSNSRLVEIAYIICDESGNIIKKKNYLVKPSGFTILNTNIHGIENDIALKEGEKIEDVIYNLENDICGVDTIVAHNIMFDLHIIISECYRLENKKIIKKIDDMNRVCTMNIGKSHMGVKKSPKLIELYKYLFGEEFQQKHRAMSDTEACMKCYFEMKNK